MAGLFGGLTGAAQRGAIAGQYDPSSLSGGDRLALFGAMLKDVGNYGQSNNISDTQQMLAGRQSVAQRLALGSQMAGMFGGQAPGQAGAAAAPGQAAPGPDMQAMAPVFARAAAMGIDIAPYLSLYEKMQPDVQVANGVAYDRHGTAPGSRIGVNLQNVNGRLVDTQDAGNANAFVPSVKEGQEVVYNAQGQPIGIRDLQGNNTTFDAQMRRLEANSGAMNARSNAQQANTGASRNAYEQGTGQKPKPWDRSWK